MLFAALTSREDDLLSRKVQNYSSAEAKTARKFRKTWMTKALRPHVTIRIGPAGERHLTEHEARRQFEEAQTSGRAAPTEHWVAEHERRYSNGMVVQVRAHKRDKPADWVLPVRVVGPRMKRSAVRQLCLSGSKSSKDMTASQAAQSRLSQPPLMLHCVYPKAAILKNGHLVGQKTLVRTLLAFDVPL